MINLEIEEEADRVLDKKRLTDPQENMQKSESSEKVEEGEEESDEESESSSSEIEVFAQTLRMRSNRGSKIQKLLRRNKFEEDDDEFWKNNDYFGSNCLDGSA